MQREEFYGYCTGLGDMLKNNPAFASLPPSIISDYIRGTGYGFGQALRDLAHTAYGLLIKSESFDGSDEALCGLAADAFNLRGGEDYRFAAYYFAVCAMAVALGMADAEKINCGLFEEDGLTYESSPAVKAPPVQKKKPVTPQKKSIDGATEITKINIRAFKGKIDAKFYGGSAVKVSRPEAADIEENGKAVSLILNKNTSSPVTVYIPQGKRDIDIEVNAGSFTIADGVYGNLRLNLNAGSLYAPRVTADLIAIELNSGSASLHGVTCGHIAVEVNAGSLNLGVSGIESEYSVSVKKSAGSCNLLSHSGSTSKSLDIEVNAGSCSVKFSN